MKKRLLMQCLVALFAVGASAANIGDYIYTPNAKLKVTGENLVTNGAFNVGDGAEGWKNENAGALTENWTVVTNAGPKGENAIQSQGATTDEGTALCNSWELTNGIYAISYWVKSATGSTSITAGQNNFVNFFANEDGSQTVTRQISEAQNFAADTWTQIVDTIFVEVEKEYLVLKINNVVEGAQFTNFEIQQVDQVYDTRIIDRLINYAESLLGEEVLAEGKDDFQGVVEMMKGMVADPAQNESPEAMESLIDSFNDEFDNYMNANGGNTKSTTGDWTQITSKGFKGLTSFGAWQFGGGRWGFSANDATLGLPENDGYVAGAGIQKGWDQVWPAYIETTALQTGAKYFFSIEAKVIPASNTSISNNPPYGENYSVPVLGGTHYKMFIGTDTLTLEGDTLSGYYWKKYYMIAEIPADADAVRAGWIYTFPKDFAMGQRAYLRNPEFRLIGKSEEVLKWEAAIKEVAAQQIELKKRIDTYPASVADYKWCKDSLQRAIVDAQPVYEYSLTIVDPVNLTCTLEMNDDNQALLGSLNGKDGLVGDLLAQVNAMGRAKNYIVAQNQVLVDMPATIADANEVLADALYATSDQATFKAAIATAQSTFDTVFANTTDDTRAADSVTVADGRATLIEAIAAYKASMTLEPIVDIDFSNPFTHVVVDEENSYYVIEGNAGQMVFAEDAVSISETAIGYPYELGWTNTDSETVLGDVLRVGKADATVTLPETANENEALRVQFDVWVGNLTKNSFSIQLKNEADERVAGFNLNRYEGTSEYNDFNNADNTGLDLLKYVTGVGSSSASNDKIYVDNNKSSFDLAVDYKSQTLKGVVTNGTNGTCKGVNIAFPAVEDNKVVKFVLASTYANLDRRCWFDNLKIFKYASSGDTGISTMSVAQPGSTAIYTLSGVRVSAPVKGLYIRNGKKFVVK